DVLLEQAASIAFEMTALHRDLARGDWRHERIRIDLPMRMVERCAHFDATVLERHHVLDVGMLAQLRRAVGPHLDERLEMREVECAEAAACRGCVHHDFAYP